MQQIQLHDGCSLQEQPLDCLYTVGTSDPQLLASNNGLSQPVECMWTALLAVSVCWCRWGATPLQNALLGGHDLVCDLIRSFGGRLELQHAPKALGQAASAGDVRRISLLVENGVPVDMPDYDGRTALHLAATEGHLLAVYILLHRWVLQPMPAGCACIIHHCTPGSQDVITVIPGLCVFVTSHHGRALDINHARVAKYE